ncbi:putative Ig domain-containing protein [Nitrospira sp. M1]
MASRCVFFAIILLSLIMQFGVSSVSWSHDHDDYAAAERARQRNEPVFVAPLSRQRVGAFSENGKSEGIQALATSGPLNQVGQWGPIVPWAFAFASAANLPDGRIIAWGANNRFSFTGGSSTFSAIWDPGTGQFQQSNHASHPLFCGIPTMLEDGRVFVNGGDANSDRVSTFNYRTGQWTRVENMSTGRWYPGSLALPDGGVMTLLGRPGGPYPELWREGQGWSLQTGANLNSGVLNFGGYQSTWLPYIHLMPSGDVFHTGPTTQMNIIDPNGNGAIASAGLGNDWYPKYSTNVMYDEGKLLVAGGAVDNSSSSPGTNQAMIIDLNGPTPEKTTIAPMAYARKFNNGVVLPTGEVLVIGGNTSGIEFSDQGTILAPEIWNPDTQVWREVADMSVPRNYHSVALLMTDGRVWSGGGGLCNCSADHPDHQVYSPPYLFNADGSLATRPVITAAPTTVGHGDVIAVHASSNVEYFTVVKMSGITHNLNSDLRFLKVPFSSTGTGEYELTMHANTNILTPGFWMLFAVNSQGVPSVAKVMQVLRTPPRQGAYRYVRFVADSEINGKPWTNMAELNVLDSNGNRLSQTEWSVMSFDSEETVGEDGRAANAIDGNPTTFWHTEWAAQAGDDNDPAHPHEMVIDLGAGYSLGGFAYLPRPGGGNGTVAAYRLYISTDGVNWGSAVAQGTFANNADEKTVLFNPPTGNQAPVVTNPGEQTHTEGGTVTLPISASDPDGDTLSYGVSGLPSGLSINSSTGVISGTVASGSAGPFSVTVDVSDGTSSAGVTFTWTIRTPSANVHRYVRFVADSEVNGKPWTSMAELNVLDSNGNRLSQTEWSVISFDSEETVQDGRVVNAIDGSPTTIWHTEWAAQAGDDNDPAHPHEMVIDLGAGYGLGGFAYLPRPGGGNGTVAAYRLYISTDGVNWGSAVAQGTFANNADEKTVLFNPPTGNHAPVVTNPGEQMTNEGEQVTLALMATDADGDTLTYSVTGIPLGLSIDPLTGVISGTIGTGSTGAYSAIVTVADGTDSANVTFSWIITVVANHSPVLTNPGPQSHMAGDRVSLSVAASDGDGDTLTFRAVGLPTGLSIDSMTGIISGVVTSVGTTMATLEVFDGQGGQDAVSFDWTIAPPPSIIINPMPTTPYPIGQSLTYSATVGGGTGIFQYKWLFGDNTPETAYSSSATIAHTFQNPGRYIVTLTVKDSSAQEVSRQFYQAIHRPLTESHPNSSMSIRYEVRGGNDRVWNVNPDNDTVSVYDTVTQSKIAEIAVGDEPRSLALAPNGQIWVANHSSATVSIIDSGSFDVVQTIDLPAGSRPFGIVFDPAGNHAYVVLQATGIVLRLSPSTGDQSGSVNVGSHPRHLAVNADGSKLYVSRFITPMLPEEETAHPQIAGAGGEVIVVNAATLSVNGTSTLAVNNGTDFEAGARGVPNYLAAPVIAPDGSMAWVPSKQDNILRGVLRDGNDLNFEHTVRAISSRLDLSTDREDFSARLDHDNAGVGSAGAFDAYGNYYFVALETSREIAVIDAYQRSELFRFDVGRAPQGLVIAPDGLTLYVHNFMDRSVGVFDLSPLINVGSLTVHPIATYTTVSNETLSNQVLSGKQFFYDARDPRLARDRYMSCASCHNNGGHDGRVWDLTGAGEGLRNTISLNGRGGSEHGRLHWTGNFDEVQDFEGQIRSLAGGTGLMNDTNFNATSDPLGAPKTGLSGALDALAAYVESLTKFSRSPHRASNGELTPVAVAGRTVFESNNCASCHGGQGFTDSSSNRLHNVGTIKTASGQRLGGPLTGLDSPTLRGVWSTAPYLHDGSAATLTEAVTAHAGVSLTASQLDGVVAFLKQIDDHESAPVVVNSPPVLTNPGLQTNVVGETVSLTIQATDVDGDVLTYRATGLPAGLTVQSDTGEITGMLAVGAVGSHTVVVSADDGLITEAESFTWSVNAPSIEWRYDFETTQGWINNPSGTDTATTGQWERADPQGTSHNETVLQLGHATSGLFALVTEGAAGQSVGTHDIDNGFTSIQSPPMTVPAGAKVTLSFAYYLAHLNNATNVDYLRVQVVGATTVTVFQELGDGANDSGNWNTFTTDISSFAGQTITVLIIAADAGSGSLIEAAVDDVEIRAVPTGN